MPVFGNDEVMTIPGSSFQFSAVKPDKLEATEYTLVTVVVDKTGSVDAFAGDLLNMLQEVIKACQKNPRSENLMVRLISFNTQIDEVHGFKLLAEIDAANYSPFICNGGTALYDACFSAIGATLTYGSKLTQNDFTVNGAIYIITDGDDNASKCSQKMIADALKKSKSAEIMESLITVLIGINTAECGAFLSNFQAQAGITQYVDMGNVTAGKLAKLAGFISKSISSQSQSLGTGGPSQPVDLTF